MSLEDNSLNILHLSDLHFGKDSIARDSGFKTSFDDFFSLLIDEINKKIHDYHIKIVVITGDLVSRGNSDQIQIQKLNEFFTVFIQNKIPIIISNGNHDLNRELIEKGIQFQDYIKFLKGKFVSFGCVLSKDFETNQASYIYIKKFNSIFISVNSCKNIEKKIINEEDLRRKHVKNPDDYLNKEYLDVGFISRKDLSDFFNELIQEYGIELFKKMNKFLICHHSLDEIEKSKLGMNFLTEKNIGIILSGHKHQYYFKSNGEMLNLGAGSLLSGSESRKDNISLNENPTQFNIYNFDLIESTIKPFVYVYDYHSKWVLDEEVNKKAPFKHRFECYLDIETWIAKNKIRGSIIGKLKELGIISVYLSKVDTNIPPYLFFNSENKKIDGFLIQENDTQLKVDTIRNWIVLNLSKFDIIRNDFIIVKNTNKFQAQLPDIYIIQ